jgi:Predicted nucleotide-binding protein containing TIR-like domain
MPTFFLRPSEVFIASSGRAKTLAQTLAVFLSSFPEITVKPWSVDSFHAGNPFLEDLIKAAKRASFAIVLFTRDDKVIQSKNKDSLLLDVPRDNCIFELGLFIGALGMDPKRCFVVGSIDENAMPSDLKGYTYIDFDEDGKDLSDYGVCREMMQPISLQLVDRINQIGPYLRPVIPTLSLDELIKLESSEYISRDSEIIVHAEKPIETKYRYAERVLYNMRRGIKYSYFFDCEKNGAMQIVNMIQTLAVVGADLGATNWDSLDDREQLAVLNRPDNQAVIRNNLQLIKAQLKIHLLPFRAAEAFCIHNAGFSNPGKGYLRWGDNRFVELSRQEAATKYEAYRRFRHAEHNHIFGNTRHHTNWSRTLKSLGLPIAIRQKFPSDLGKHVEKLCFRKVKSKGGVRK